MAASCYLSAQAVITFDIGLGFTVQGQCLRGIQRRTAHHLAVDQAVQQVQHMGFGRHTLGQCQLHGCENGLFIVMQHEGKDIDHLAITARFAEHVILQLFEGWR
jgi:hypothetical protein